MTTTRDHMLAFASALAVSLKDGDLTAEELVTLAEDGLDLPDRRDAYQSDGYRKNAAQDAAADDYARARGALERLLDSAGLLPPAA